MTRIPKILHFCFGLAADFGGKPWSLIHYVSVRSAVERIKPTEAFIYYEYEPTGVWWAKTKEIVTPVQIKAPREIFGNPVLHPAHRADVVRLQKLIEHGGIYLDADVLVHRDFDDLLNNSTVLGTEGTDGRFGLANAVILAEPQAPFLKRWYDEYRTFRSKGRDQYWSEHSVRLPFELSKKHPEEITVLDHKAFFWPLWTPDHLKLIYAAPARPEERATYGNHLWESHAWERYLDCLTPGDVRRVDSNFHIWARPFVADLSDNFGKPGVDARLKRSFNLQLKRGTSFIGHKLWQIRSLRGKIINRISRLTSKFISTFGLDRIPFVGRWHRERVFNQVYEKGLWGGEASSKFFSGLGSRGDAAAFYIENMATTLAEYAQSEKRQITVVDLGCGDFNVGRALVEKVAAMKYIGCDIVPTLIEHHQREFSNERVRFKVVDFVSGRIPDGDVCLIRQAFQHLSNSDIEKTIKKLGKFEKVYVTEGYPANEQGPINPDKPADHEVRYDWRTGVGRGVELDKSPYHLKTREIFRVEADSSGREILKTYELFEQGLELSVSK